MQNVRKVLYHPYIKIYILYSLTFITLGISLSGLGPLIPYLADHENHSQLEYSFLFSCRAGGYILGSLLMKVVENHLNLHQIMIISFIFTAAGIPFSFIQNFPLKGLFMFVFSFGNSWTDISINICIIMLFEKDNLNAWMQVAHGIFGIGGLAGAYVVYLCQIYTFGVLGIIGLIFLPFYIYCTSPEDRILSLNEQLVSSSTDEPEQKTLSTGQIVVMGLMFILMIGQESSYAGWISSYATYSNYSSKQKAVFFSSLYWISITLFRFIFPFIPLSSFYKLFTLYIIAVITSIVCLFIIHDANAVIGLIIASVLLGMTDSITFPQTLTYPSEYNYMLTQRNNSTFILCLAIGDGVIAFFAGILMKSNPDMLFYEMGAINLLLVLLLIETDCSMIKGSRKGEEESEFKSIKTTESM